MKRVFAVLLSIFDLAAESLSRDPVGYEALLERLVFDFKTPGIAVAVLDDLGFKEYTFGVSSVETGKPVTRETLYNAASISN